MKAGRLVQGVLVAAALATALAASGAQGARRAGGAYQTYLPLAARNTELGGGTADTPVGSVGSAAFTLDSGRQATLAFAHDGTAQTLSATDAAGNTWTLSIPADALLWPRQITMTPFSAVSASDPSIALKGGVLLEPDGLQFANPATLSVTPPSGKSAQAPLLAVDQQGANMVFAETTVSGSTASAPIWHFSGAVWSDPDDLAPMRTAAEREYQAAVAAAQAFVKAPPPTPPTPPAHSLYCQGTAAGYNSDAEDDRFIAEFTRPYNDVIRALLGSARTLEMLGESSESSALELAQQVAGVEHDQAFKMLKQYEHETPPDHITAVIKLNLAVERQWQLLGGAPSTVLDEVAYMVGTARAYYLDQLRNHDEYQAVSALIQLERERQMLGGVDDGFFDMLVKAMTFRVLTDTTVVVAGGHIQVVNTGSALVPMHLVAGDGHWYKDSGSGSYTSGSEEGYPLELPDSFKFDAAWDNFDPCVSRTVDIYTGAFGALTEQFEVPNQPPEPGYANGAGFNLFRSKKITDLSSAYADLYDFNQTVAIQGKEASDQTWTASGYEQTITYRLQLVHEPQ